MIYVNSLPECENESAQADPKQASSAPQETESQLSGQPETGSPDNPKQALLTAQNRLSGQPEIGSLDSPKSAGIYTENNYTENNYQENIYPQSISYDETIEDVEYQIEYDVLSERDYGGVLDEIVSLIADTLCADAPSVRIAGRQVPIETVRSRFAKLTAEHIEHVIKTLEQNAVNVRNMRAYMLTAIYNSIDALELIFLEGYADASKGRHYEDVAEDTRSFLSFSEVPSY